MNKLVLLFTLFAGAFNLINLNVLDQQNDGNRQRAEQHLKSLQVYYSEGNYEMHKTYSDSLLLVAKEHGFTKLHILALNNQAVFYKNRSERLKAIDLYHEALEKCKLIPEDVRTKIIVLINMGNIYNDIDSYDKAIEYMEKVLVLLEPIENSERIEAAALIGLANNYIKFKNYEKTIFYANKAKNLGVQIGNEEIIVSATNNISDAYIALKDYKKALEVSESASNLSLLTKPTKKRASFLLNVGIANFRLNNLDIALNSLNECLELSKEKNIVEIQMYAHEYLAKVYEQKKNYKASVLEQKEYSRIRDLYLKDSKDASNADLNKEFTQKSEEIEASNEALENVNKTQNFMIFIGGGTLLVLSGFLFFYIKRKRKLDYEQAKLQTQHLALQQSISELKSTSTTIISNKISAAKGELKPYKNSSLTPEKREEFKKHILAYMAKEKPFLNPEMTQSDLAEKLNISSHHFSEVLYYNMEQNFYNFINSYRVLEAQRLMKDPNNSDTKIIAIAFDSGFKSKTSFNRVFKNHTGSTPSDYKKAGL